MFPFGYGLSYTTFNIESKCEYDQNKKIFTVTSKVTNTGKRSGKQVVQVYVKKPENKTFIKAQRELVAFNKTKEIKPGEVQELTMTFELKYLSSYDDIGVTGNPACYVLDKGYYDIYVGDSVMATRNAQNIIYTYTQNEIEVLEKLTNRLIPKDPDVFDANTKPDFNDLFFDNDQENYECTKDNIINNNYHYSENNEENRHLNIKSLIKDNLVENENTNLPTDRINTINFKTVLTRNYTLEQLVDTMTNEELAFLSFGKIATIRDGTGIIGGYYNSGDNQK